MKKTKSHTICSRCKRRIKHVVGINGRNYGYACAKIIVESDGYKLPSGFSGDWDKHLGDMTLMLEIDYSGGMHNKTNYVKDISLSDCKKAFEKGNGDSKVLIEQGAGFFIIKLKTKNIVINDTYHFNPDGCRIEKIGGLDASINLDLGKVFKEIIIMNYEL